MKSEKKDICADLEKAQKKKSVGKWLKERKIKKGEKQCQQSIKN